MFSLHLFEDLFMNILSLMSKELFVTSFSEYDKQQVRKIRFIMFPIWIIYSFLPTIPYNFLITKTLDFLYILIYVNYDWKKSLKLFLKYYIFILASSGILLICHTLLLQDMGILSETSVYITYKSFIVTLLIYILLNVYLNTKKLSTFTDSKSYQILFNLIILISVVTLSISIMLVGSPYVKQADVLPMVFLLVSLIIVLCLFAYRHICKTLEEHTLDRMQLHKSKLELEYYANVYDDLHRLSMLRHDMKNHLIVIDEYATKHLDEKIHTYISEISDTFQQANLIKTPSMVISSILNSKQRDCQQKHITFSLIQEFSDINIDDYHMITLLGNMLDNAIQAATKVPNGYVNLSIKQLDSYLAITCENNHCEHIQKKNGNFITSNRLHPHLHGFGLKSIKKAIEELNGELDIQYTDRFFCLSLLIPNYK